MNKIATAILISLVLAGFFTRSSAASPRERIRIDAGWRFHRGDLGQNAGFALSAWRWTAAESTALPAPGAESNWQEAGPGLDVFHGRRGFAWFRATLPAVAAKGRTLHFESVDDNASVWLNGRMLTHHEGWNDPFDVQLDAAWQTDGPNVLSVLVENTAGAGGIGAAEIHADSGQAASGPALQQFDDHDWRRVHLPHDFVVEGEFTPKADAGHGSLPTDVAWYRRDLQVPASDRGRRIALQFDGMYRNSLVWLNGHLLGNHKSGYTGVRYDISSVVNYGGPNTIAVRLDARAQEGWWYEGGGIYRHVWLEKTAPVHITPNGVFITSSVKADGAAVVTVQAEVENTTNSPAPIEITTSVAPITTRAAANDAQSAAAAPIPALAAGDYTKTTASLTLPNPRLWSLATPNLYRAVTTVRSGGRIVDTVETRFGIRTIRFDADKGFFLNGKPVKIQGTCNHQDFAGVGIAMTDSVLEWRIKKLLEMGCNAYRMSHNPPAPELIDACDRLGMLVMDENRHLGDTYRDHTPSGTGFTDLSDLRELILRDRNHPSVIMWSMCNEEGLQGSDEGAQIFAAMKTLVLQNDPTRPVTCAMNGGWGSGISLVEDLQGCNYNPGGYDGYHKAFPHQPMYGSETASAVSTRGEYVNDEKRGYVSAYDLNAPSWAQTAEVAWSALATRPFMAGGYVWTGFDYKGEPTPYGWPCINSHFGIMDECGFPKDTYYYYQSWWTNRNIVHILPHWNWTGQQGRPIDVWCHSNADRVELFLNGKSLGAKEMPRYSHLEWKAPYQPGRLEAKAYRAGKLVATDVVETTGAPVRLRLSTDRKSLTPDGEDTAIVKVEVLDAKGRVVPTADPQINFAIDGPAAIAGVGNGDPSSHEPDKATKRHAFHGLALAVIQAKYGSGRARLTAAAAGLAPAQLEINLRK